VPTRALRLVNLAALALAAAGLAAGCGGTTVDDTPAATTAAEAPQGATVADLDDLHGRIVDAGFACELEYEGLRDEGRTLSLCVIDGDRATLTVWDDPTVLTDLVAGPDRGSGVVVVGRNWTIDLQSSDLADRLGAALDGTVVGG